MTKTMTEREELGRLARKYVWWSPPEMVLAEGFPRLVASVMELGTWEDAMKLLEIAGRDIFTAVLKNPPAGVISDKSLAFWHYRLGLEGAAPKAARRFA